MAPYGIYHERQWVKIVARLYIKYGGPETVEWAYHHERRGGNALKRLLAPAHLQRGNREAFEAAHQCRDGQRLFDAVHRLVVDLKAQGGA
jgi:hypothetical protein